MSERNLLFAGGVIGGTGNEEGGGLATGCGLYDRRNRIPMLHRLAVFHAVDVDGDNLCGSKGLYVFKRVVQHNELAVLKDAVIGIGDP